MLLFIFYIIIMDDIYRYLLQYDDTWCNTMGIFNPYVDPFETSFTKKLPMFDKRAYHLYPKYNFVYDKLWVAQSQDLSCGTIESIQPTSSINYPIFIKPRWGHKSASSKNCFKINDYHHLKKYQHLSDMMWSTYIEGVENMTDFLLVNGNIVYDISYNYSQEQNGYTECYKVISPDLKPPPHIVNWVKHHMVGYSGVVNVQYRGKYIIEAGLRLARGGAYIQSTGNDNLVRMINQVYEYNTFTQQSRENITFSPFYSFKCFTRIPILYLYPQYIVDILMKVFGAKPFYEYYFEPNGNDGCVFFQFLHDNKTVGEWCKEIFTYLFIFAQLFFLSVIGIIIYFFTKAKYKWNKTVQIIFSLTFVMYLTQYLNPVSVHYNLYKAKKQKTWW